MPTRWMTLRDIAEERHITLSEAQSLVETLGCPKVFRTRTTLYLV